MPTTQLPLHVRKARRIWDPRLRRTYNQHLRNTRAYQNMLNRERIYR